MSKPSIKAHKINPATLVSWGVPDREPAAEGEFDPLTEQEVFNWVDNTIAATDSGGWRQAREMLVELRTVLGEQIMLWQKMETEKELGQHAANH